MSHVDLVIYLLYGDKLKDASKKSLPSCLVVVHVNYIKS